MRQAALEQVHHLDVVVGQLDPEAVVAHLATRLADFKVPQYLAVSDAPLPRNPGGKLLKRQLRESVRWDEVYRR